MIILSSTRLFSLHSQSVKRLSEFALHSSSSFQGRLTSNFKQIQPLPSQLKRFLSHKQSTSSKTARKMVIHKPDVANMRKNYDQGTLHESQVQKNPIDQFTIWFEEAKSNLPPEHFEVNACSLSTVDPITHRPSNRILLMKDFSHEEGFRFFTNYLSKKGTDLQGIPFAAMTFYWKERSVRIEGSVEKVSTVVSDTYFASRPRKSQIGAWVSSSQSSVICSREELEATELEMEKKFQDVETIPRPDYWGGYRLIPDRIEFWQGRTSRLHDRIVYTLQEDRKTWKVERLAP